MIIKSYAKINLSLIVNKKIKKTGLHNIQSKFCLIDLFDTISIKKNKKSFDAISFSGPFSQHLIKNNNTIQKVLQTMRKLKLISSFYTIKVNKKIPVFAGLGGGSSNAAAVLKFLHPKIIKEEILNKIIDEVGSDLRLFFYNQGFLYNLKKVIKFKKKHNLFFLVVYPYIKCSTKQIYSKVKNHRNRKINKKKLHKGVYAFINEVTKSNNDLQSIVEKKYPDLKKLISNISKEKGCYFSRMTGSGSACYGLFRDKRCSKVAVKRLRKKYPKFWFSIAKTI